MDYFQYDRHDAEWERCLTDPERMKIAETWGVGGTLDAWRHERMYSQLAPFIPTGTWLTVGDGRFGADAQHLISRGATVHCSDVSDRLLSIAHKRGLIAEYSKQNAENLTFENDSFDYVYCKESFHHFPRPHIALHEMFRVARKAVILTEPRDHQIDRAPMSWLIDLGRRLTGKGERHDFEPVGNYIYGLSEREVEKFALGMHYRNVAFLSLNDAFCEGVERSPIDPAIERRLKSKIAFLDALDRFGIRRSGLLTAVIFKAPPEVDLKGWRFKKLPLNPYL